MLFRSLVRKKMDLVKCGKCLFCQFVSKRLYVQNNIVPTTFEVLYERAIFYIHASNFYLSILNALEFSFDCSITLRNQILQTSNNPLLHTIGIIFFIAMERFIYTIRNFIYECIHENIP